MAGAGAPSTAPALENRHDTIPPISSTENLGRCLGCRRYVGDRRQDFDRARPGGRGRAPRTRNHFYNHQQPTTPRLAHAARPLEITTPIGSFNGGVIARPDLSVITEHLLSPEVARRAVDMLDAHQVQVWVFSGQDWLVRDLDGPYVGLEERTVGFRRQWSKISGPALDVAAKIVGVSKDFELLAQCERDVTRRARRSGFRRSFAALLPRHHPPACQQRRRIIGAREAVGHSAGGDRRHRRRRQ